MKNHRNNQFDFNRYLLIFANCLIIMAMLCFVAYYLNITSKNAYEQRKRQFEDMTKSLVKTTENYLYGSQEIVDNWEHYINSNNLTIEEAIEYLRICKGKDSSYDAQILFVDTDEWYGMSAEPDIAEPDNYLLKVTKESFFIDLNVENYYEEGFHLTRRFTNQHNGKQSVAFYNYIRLIDGMDGRDRQAVLMFVIPIDTFEQNLRITNTTFGEMNYAIATHAGDYISKNGNFKNTNVYEYLNSYNNYTLEEFEILKEKSYEEFGVFDALNENGELVHYAHATMPKDTSFIIVSAMNDAAETITETDFILILIIAIGLLAILAVNIFAMFRSNVRLSQAREAAEQANEAKSVFLSTMSHDIRTPINAILGFSNMAAKNLDDKEAVKEDLDKISSAGDHLLLLVNDVLELAKIENNQIKLEKAYIDIEDFIETIINIAEPIANDKSIKIKVKKINIFVASIIGDRLRLSQIYLNVISNAVKYTNEGGNVDILFEELKSDNPAKVIVRIIVSDNGIGMSEDFVPHMFEAFVREEDGRTSTVRGTGLGLAITKQFVDLMEGNIECVTSEGKGSTFTIDIPLEIAEIEESKEQIHVSDNKACSLKGLKILVAEDNELNYQIVSQMLEFYGVWTKQAVNGKIAVEKLEENPNKYDIVLMDLRMPIMDGFEATKQIRSSEIEKVKNIPIIALTADAFAEVVDSCKEAGMNAHISKPIYEDELINEIIKVYGEKVNEKSNN